MQTRVKLESFTNTNLNTLILKNLVSLDITTILKGWIIEDQVGDNICILALWWTYIKPQIEEQGKYSNKF